MNILFLDDQNIRHESIEKRFKNKHNILHAYNSQDAINILLNYNKKIDLAMLDHDLFDFVSEDGTPVDYNFIGKKIERDGCYFLKQVFNFITKDKFPKEFIIHSHNTVGSKKMVSLLNDNNLTANIIPFSIDSINNLLQTLGSQIVEETYEYDTPENLLYRRKKEVKNNLKIDRHYYDNHISNFMDKKDINEDAVRRFFDLEFPSRIVEIYARLSGAGSFDAHIRTTLNPSLQDAAMLELDKILFDEKNLEWLSSIYEWDIDYDLGISVRSFSGIAKDGKICIDKWIKECQKKFGKCLKVSV